jgi:predicted nucleic acid-binding protein
MALSKIGYIVYLRELFGRVSIPKTDFVLLDDLEARVYARSSGLNVIGTLGIIQALLRRGIVKETPKEIYRKLKSIDFWITNDLFSKVFV